MKVKCIVDKGWPLPSHDSTFNHPAEGALRLSNGEIGEVDEDDENIQEAIAKGHLEQVDETTSEAVEEEE